MQDFDIFGAEGVFFLTTPLRVSWQGIDSFVYLALIVINSEVVTRKFLSLADLPRAQTLCVHESTKVVVVYKDKDLMFTTFEVMLPGFKCLNDG